MDILWSIFGFFLSLSLVSFTIPALIRVSIAKHLYDEPNERKVSKGIVPTLGGVAIFIGFTLSSLIATDGYNFGELKYLIASVIIIFFIGLKDDLMDISALKKLMVQIVASLLLITLGNFRLTSLHGIFGIHEISYFVSLSISLFLMIGLINAFNLIDGIDGLASGIGILISSVFGTWFLLAGHHEYAIISFSLLGSLIGFFIYNVYGKKYKIFMGDTGSLIIGITMAALAIKFNEFNIIQDIPYAVKDAPVVSIGILIIPIIDTCRVFFIRISERKSPFSPDMNHIHHKFLNLGFSHLQASLLMISINALFIITTFYFSKLININNLIILTFGFGFLFAFLPCFIFNCSKQSLSKSVTEITAEAPSKLIKVNLPANPLPLVRKSNSSSDYEEMVIKKEISETAH